MKKNKGGRKTPQRGGVPFRSGQQGAHRALRAGAMGLSRIVRKVSSSGRGR